VHPGALAMDGLLLAMTAAGAVTDVRVGKVYNVLTYTGALAGLALNGLLPAPPGLGWSAAFQGLLLGWGPLFVAFLAGGIGAGDVKLMAAVGAFVGPHTGLFVLLYACLAGAVMAMGVILWKEGYIGLLLRIKAVFTLQGGDDGFQRLKFPFGVAILVGTAWAVTERNLGASALDLVFGKAFA